MQVERVRLGEDGSLVIPAAMWQGIGVRTGDTLVIESDGDSLLLRTLDRVMREVQEGCAPYPLPEAGLAAELIADRRADAAGNGPVVFPLPDRPER